MNFKDREKGIPYQVGIGKFSNSFIDILCRSFDLVMKYLAYDSINGTGIIHTETQRRKLRTTKNFLTALIKKIKDSIIWETKQEKRMYQLSTV